MKVVKPLKIGLLFRTVEVDTRPVLAITILCLVNPGKTSLLGSEPDLWKMVAAELGREAVLDMGMPKPQGEVLISGSYFAPGAKPVTAGQVTAGVGGWHKQLYVFGDRYWYPQAGLWHMSEPKAMTSMSVTWSNAFGGPQYKPNPLGKGVGPETLPSGQGIHPLPNIESPDRLIRQRSDRPEPAGFGPLDIAWPQRFAKAGTYDRKWLNERFPGYADDMDWSIFNAAPADQYWNGYFNGDETFSFENMHPANPLWQGQLPGLRMRCFAVQTADGREQFKPLTSRLDTVWFFPHLEKALLIHRALLEVADDEAADVTHLLLACEGAADPVRGDDHYKTALEKRLDEENGHLHALNEAELLPLGEKSAVSEMLDELPAQPTLLNDHLAERARREKEAAVRKLTDLGFDPGALIKPPEPQPELDLNSLDKLPEVIAQLTRQAETSRQAMQQQARERLAAMGLDEQAVRAAAEQQTRRWPKFSAQENIEKLRSHGIDDPAAEAQLKAFEDRIAETVRPVVHHLPPSWEPRREDRHRLREQVMNCKASGNSLRDVDLAYADLSGLDLSGMNLSGAYLEGVNFSGSNLSATDLRQAVLVRARFAETDLGDAQLNEANLGSASLSASRLTRAILTGAVLAQCTIQACALDEADMVGVDFTKASIHDCDFSRSRFNGVTFIETRLTRCRFRAADLRETMFLQAALDSVDFSLADLSAASFVSVQAPKTLLAKARLSRMSLAGECDFQGADFSESDVTGANLRGCNLSGASFKKADLSGSDLSECRLNGCDFSLARARQTQMVKADLTGACMIGIDLMEGSLQKATLHETDIRASNLYSVDFMKVRFRNTDLRDSNVKKAFLERWIPKNQ